MKATGIAVILMLPLIVFSVALDFLGGKTNDIKEAFLNTINPLFVMEKAELFILVVLLLCLFITPVRLYLRKRSKSKQ